MKFSKKLLLFTLLLPAFVSCDLEQILDDLCEGTGDLVYCLEFAPLDEEGNNVLKSGELDTDGMVITAVRSDEEEYIVYETADWGNSIFNQESIFIDFGDEDNPEAIITALVFEGPNMETTTYKLDIKDKYGENCMVDYSLVKDEDNTDTQALAECTSCQVGVQNITFELNE